VATPASRFIIVAILAAGTSCGSPSDQSSPGTASSSAPAGRTEACWTATLTTGVQADEATTRLIQVLATEKNAADNKKAHRDAASALGKRGAAAWPAVMPLYASLNGENAFEAALDGTYADVVTTAIAAIAQDRAVPLTLAVLKTAQGTQLQADRAIWGTVIRKVGGKTAPCLCEIVVSDERPDLVVFATMMLQSLAERNALQHAKPMALASVQKILSHADERVRQTAAEALAAIEKSR
jgi:HEAT repeat protein